MAEVHTSPTNEVRLSQSQLWTFQKAFYEQEGIQAWASKIPFFSTTNVFIANSYANIILRFMQEWSKRNSDSQEPFYLLELGSGTGMFGYYLLTRLLELQRQLLLTTIPFVYVMSDFVQQNIDFWKAHPALEEFIAGGQLGFARYEIGVSETLEIDFVNRVGPPILISLETPTSKPLIVIANYIFDSLPCDVFRLERNQLLEGLTRPNIRPNNNMSMNLGAAMNEAGFDFIYQQVVMPYYNETSYDMILSHYTSVLEEANFLFPVGSLNCMEVLRKLSRDRLFLMATDKAYGKQAEYFMASGPDIVLHNSAFSVTVNFDAIARYVEQHGGTAYLQSTPASINTSVFSVGADISQMPETLTAAEYFIDVAGPASLFSIYTHFEWLKESASIGDIIAFLNLLHWDPYVLNSAITVLITKIAQIDYPSMVKLLEGISRSTDLYYHIPGSVSFYHDTGMLLQGLGYYESALTYYSLSNTYHEEQSSSFFNMGLCHYYLNNYVKATDCFKQALLAGYSDPITIKGWIVESEEQMTFY